MKVGDGKVCGNDSLAIHCWYIKCGEATISCQYLNSEPIYIPELQIEFSILVYKRDNS
jgi:hypothetical protein